MTEEGRLEHPKRAYCEESKCCFTLPKDDSRLYCCKCAHKRRASFMTCLAICFLVLTYNLLGAFLFLALEGNQTQETAVAASKPNLSQGVSQDLRSKTVEKLWSITEDLNILYKENWTKLAAKELMDFQKVLMKTMRSGGAAPASQPALYDADAAYRWTFSTSFLYALTLITTIGHGNVTPRSSAGKMAAVAYASIGIPIIMLYLSTLGEALARSFRALYSRLCPPRAGPADPRLCAPHRTPFQAALNLESFHGGYHWTCRDHTRVPILLSLMVIALYIAVGSVVFHKTEKWSLIDGCFFSFASLATIGMGDLRPGLYASTKSPTAEDIAVGVCCIYILVGIVVTAMCFNLIQEDVGTLLKSVTMLCSGGGKARVVHGAERPDERAPPS